MSSCSSCCSTRSVAPVALSPKEALAQRDKALKAAADRLGMSVEDVEKARRAGVNLNQLAASKGVAHDDLIASITGVVNPNDPSHPATTAAAEAITAKRAPRVSG